MAASLTLALLVLALHSFATFGSQSCGVSTVLVGGTGDLAKRYIWPALFENIVLKQASLLEKCTMAPYGTYRGSPNNTNGLDFSTLDLKLHCPASITAELCLELKRVFSSGVRLLPLNSDDDFRALAQVLEGWYAEKNASEAGRLFYLAIPPSAYPSVCRNINLYARPTTGWLRVVLEKPFGKDLSSAEQLAQSLSEHLAEEEIYRIDHYLGKLGVQQILAFREKNSRHLSPLWNAQNIQRMDVVMKERLDVKGRSQFFDEYGIVRDVLQNHHTEILARMLSDALRGPRFAEEKLAVLSRLYAPGSRYALFGQYESYLQHLQDDQVRINPGNSSRTPTFASVVLYSQSARWEGVPLILTAGKQLDERAAYARALFKSNALSSARGELRTTCPMEMVFSIQSEWSTVPGILVSDHFDSIPLEPPYSDWQITIVHYPLNSSCRYRFMYPTVVPASNPYTSLIQAILDGHKGLFVDTESLIEAWKVWTPLLEDLQQARPQLHIYSPETLHSLNSMLTPGGLLGMSDLLPTINTGSIAIDSIHCNHGIINESLSSVFHAVTYSGTRYEIASWLAKAIHTAALDAVTKRGHFHLALPGGRSPLVLYQVLSLEYQHTFPWQETHVWLTDERCVSPCSFGSNWHQLSDHLLSHLPVPPYQVHLFPIQLQNGQCSVEDQGASLYEAWLNDTAGGGLDYIVLGIGEDCHVASLFQGVELKSDGLVELVVVPELLTSRMTLTYKAIQLAQHISLLLSGKCQEKRAVFEMLKDCFKVPDCTLPARRVIDGARVRSSASIYIDTCVL